MTIDSNTVSNVMSAIGAIAAAGYAGLPLLLWRRKLNLDALHTIATVCQQVVQAIEQTQDGAPGDSKKALALDNIRTILSSLGIHVPEPFIDAAVEAAVLALGSRQSPPPSAGAGPLETTTYTYDTLGRLSQLTPPPSPGTATNAS